MMACGSGGAFGATGGLGGGGLGGLGSGGDGLVGSGGGRGANGGLGAPTRVKAKLALRGLPGALATFDERPTLTKYCRAGSRDRSSEPAPLQRDKLGQHRQDVKSTATPAEKGENIANR